MKIISPILTTLAVAMLPAIASAQGFFDQLQQLPSIEKPDFNTVFNLVKSLLQVMIQWSLAIALIALIITGYIYITSLGNQTKAEQAKKSLLYILIGSLVIIGLLAGLKVILAQFVNL